MNSQVIRLVKTRRFGSEGLIPVDKYSCPHRGKVSCVSSSGGSYCSGYGGDSPLRGTRLYSVRCLEEDNADFILQSWIKQRRHSATPHTFIQR